MNDRQDFENHVWSDELTEAQAKWLRDNNYQHAAEKPAKREMPEWVYVILGLVFILAMWLAKAVVWALGFAVFFTIMRWLGIF